MHLKKCEKYFIMTRHIAKRKESELSSNLKRVPMHLVKKKRLFKGCIKKSKQYKLIDQLF